MKQSEALLRETADRLSLSEERYRCTFEQAPVGIVHTSAEGIFLRCNARFAEIVGYPQSEIPGLSIQQVTAPEDTPVSLEKLAQVAGTSTPRYCWEKRYVRKNGSLVWAKITASAQRDDQEPGRTTWPWSKTSIRSSPPSSAWPRPPNPSASARSAIARSFKPASTPSPSIAAIPSNTSM